ncbi:hypothetical protein KTQ42_08840|uniref:virion core protein, T7 gp14 family n=1 Tax=Noviherbaspirillum sp. L7-7A TaxID=2850560 RepID=UPI001C2BB33B|nr:hypothetical protein [Noviherbaspirillum sp. L7-7A]MBV0879408.1 hypothetical protein [Noviherbaspirillum sp. L7-7A]
MTASGALAGLSAIGTGAGLYGQQQAAHAQEKSNAAQRQNAITARNQNLTQIEQQKQQLTEQAGQKVFENNLQARKALSTSRVSAGENGVSGLSVDALLGEIEASQSRYNTSVGANLTDNVTALNMQRENVQTSAVNQVSSLKTPQMPDYLGASLRIGSTLANSYKAQK